MSTRFGSNRPRVAATGFFASYYVGDPQKGYSHWFRSSEVTRLRDAFTDDTRRAGAGVNPGDRFPSMNHTWPTHKIVDELRHIKLWEGEAKKGELIVDPERVGVVFSSSKNKLHFYPDSMMDYAHESHKWSAYFLLLISGSSDYSGSFIAQNIGARGPRLSPVAACATGAHAIILGAQLIEDGYADVAICGAIEPVLTPLVLAAYENMGALSKSGVMRPFDQKRDGFVPNVGAGCLILENADKAHSRGAPIYGYLSGWSMNADATHMTAMCPSGSSIARAIEYSMRRADVQTVDYINAHGTATRLNDETEASGIFSAVGNKVPVSSTKPLTGHLLGAAGAVEAVISVLALNENFAPPTLNLENIDDKCDLDLVVGKGRDLEMNAVLSLNYGFGGHLGALLFTKA